MKNTLYLRKGLSFIFALLFFNISYGTVHTFKTEAKAIVQATKISSNLRADKLSPQDPGTKITFTASSSGAASPLYKFSLYNGKKWVTMKDYSKVSQFIWSPTIEGNYKIRVEVKDAKSAKTAISSKELSYSVKKSAKITALTTDKKAPQAVKSQIKITASAKGSKVLYRFSIFNGSWKVVQEYSSKNIYNWIPAAAGNYKIKVDVKEANSTRSSDSYMELAYSIGSSNTISGALRNTAGNANNRGIAITFNGWRYEAYNDINTFNVSNPKERNMFASSKPEFMNVVGNYIYFVEGHDRRIFRMKLDGNDKVCINPKDHIGESMIIYDNYIYYTNASDNRSLYRIGLDGTGRTKIAADTFVTNINVTDKYIYYITGVAETGEIYRINKDGSGRTLLVKGRNRGLIVDKDYLIYGDEELSYSICRRNTDGSGLKVLNHTQSWGINMSGDYIYYTNHSDNSKIYRMKKDGSNKKVIVNEPSKSPNITEDRIYYLGDFYGSQVLKNSALPKDVEDSDTVDTKELGNSFSNVVNGSFVTTKGNFVYTVEWDTVYRYNLDWTNKTAIAQGKEITSLSVVGNWVYYVQNDMSLGADYRHPYHGIYKVNITGSESPIKLSDKRARNINVVGQWIYFDTKSNEARFNDSGYIFRMKTDGTEEAYINKSFDLGTNLLVTGDYIYYVSEKNNFNLMRLNLDGTNPISVTSTPTGQFVISGSTLYFRSSGGVKKVSLSGTEEDAVTIPITAWNRTLLLNEKKLFYVRDFSIYSADLDGSNETFIAKNDRIDINVVGEYVCYYDSSTHHLIKVKY